MINSIPADGGSPSAVLFAMNLGGSAGVSVVGLGVYAVLQFHCRVQVADINPPIVESGILKTG